MLATANRSQKNWLGPGRGQPYKNFTVSSLITMQNLAVVWHIVSAYVWSTASNGVHILQSKLYNWNVNYLRRT